MILVKAPGRIRAAAEGQRSGGAGGLAPSGGKQLFVLICGDR